MNRYDIALNKIHKSCKNCGRGTALKKLHARERKEEEHLPFLHVASWRHTKRILIACDGCNNSKVTRWVTDDTDEVKRQFEEIKNIKIPSNWGDTTVKKSAVPVKRGVKNLRGRIGVIHLDEHTPWEILMDKEEDIPWEAL